MAEAISMNEDHCPTGWCMMYRLQGQVCPDCPRWPKPPNPESRPRTKDNPDGADK